MTQRLCVLYVATLLATAGGAHAALTTQACLAKRVSAWGKLRQCQRKEQAKGILGKPSDPAKCQATFDAAAGKLDTAASNANVACRYLDNADGTITDTTTGLMWEVRAGEEFAEWLDAMGTHVSACDGWSANGTTMFPACLYSDWRLPTIVELTAILDPTAPGCSFGSPCIDPVFGFTSPGKYWSATTYSTQPDYAWTVDFGNGAVGASLKFTDHNVIGAFSMRAVRNGL